MTPPVDRVLFKVAAACNLACDYCYWFRDQRVHALPRVASDMVLRSFLARLREYLEAQRPATFTVSLHGGEPMLLGFKRLIGLVIALKTLETETGVRIHVNMQTNATLIDPRWARALKELDVSVGVSLDGPEALNDAHRITRSGAPTYAAVRRGYEALTAAGHAPSLLMVYTPGLDLSRFVEVLESFNSRWLDVLIPDATWNDGEQPEIAFFPELAEFWHLHLRPRGVHVRFAANVFDLLAGAGSTSESLGGQPCRTFSVESDGRYALLDVLNAVGNGSAATGMSLADHSITEFLDSGPFAWQMETSQRLPAECVPCPFARTCGGGYFPSRWDPETGFSRKSANCRTLYATFARATRLLQEESVKTREAAPDEREMARRASPRSGLTLSPG
jgi:uncharacterized protein